MGPAGGNGGGEDAATAAARVRVYVTGAEEWRGYKCWPPASDPCIFSILKGGRIIDCHGGGGAGVAGAAMPDYPALRKSSESFERLVSADALGLPCESIYDDVSSYVYDPEDPTPGLGGCSFNPWNSGAVDSRCQQQHCKHAHPPTLPSRPYTAIFCAWLFVFQETAVEYGEAHSACRALGFMRTQPWQATAASIAASHNA